MIKKRSQCKRSVSIKRSIVPAVLSALMTASALPITTSVYAETVNQPVAVTKENTLEKTKYYSDNGLGTAGNFHITAFKEVKTGAHTEGNILTNELKYNSNFGTTGGVGEISYAKKVDIDNDGLKSSYGNQDSVLVVGKDVKVTTTDNGNAWAINGKKVDWPSKHNNPNGLWQESDTSFANLDKIQNEEESISSELAKQKNSDATASLKDQNSETITIDNNAKTAVYNMDADQNVNFLKIKGFNKNTAQTMVINVNMTGKNNFTIHGAKIVYQDGSEAPISEVNTWQKGNVVWNFYTKDGDKIEPYKGAVNTTEAVTGHILAPDATVTLGSNINGSVIANTVNVNAESHRSDYTGAKLSSTDTGTSKSDDTKKDDAKKQEDTTLTITQKWDDNNIAKARPKKIIMHVYKKTNAGDIDTGKIVTLSDTNNWTDKIKVDKFDDNGNAITYFVKVEGTLEGYTTSAESQNNTFVFTSVIKAASDKDNTSNQSKDDKSKDQSKDDQSTTKDQTKDTQSKDQTKDTSSNKQEEKTLTITQKWEDNQNKIKARPAKITLHIFKLTSDGKEVDTNKTVTLSDSNNWTSSLTVDKYDQNGQAISYIVKSSAELQNYKTETVEQGGQIILTSTLSDNISDKTDDKTDNQNTSKDTDKNTTMDGKDTDNTSSDTDKTKDINDNNTSSKDDKSSNDQESTAQNDGNEKAANTDKAETSPQNSTKNKAPQTGYDSNIVAYLTSIAAIGIASALIYRKRREN